MKAVVFVDVQNDFIDGALKNEKAQEVTYKIVDFAKECVKNGYKLYATRDTHEKTTYCRRLFDNEPDIPKSGYLATHEGIYLPIEHCIEGTDGWMIDCKLLEVLDSNCTFVNKPTFGSFDLAEIIEEDFVVNSNDSTTNMSKYGGIGEPLEEIIICGFDLAICVIANAIILRAKFPNTKITVMKDLCACVTDESHNAALKVLEMQQIEIK